MKNHVKTNKECEALDYLLFRGAGKRIQENISKEGLSNGLIIKLALINEMRLTPVDPKARKFRRGMEKFFFGEVLAPQGFVPEK